MLLINSFIYVCVQFGVGTSTGTTVRIGHALGAGNADLAKLSAGAGSSLTGKYHMITMAQLNLKKK